MATLAAGYNRLEKEGRPMNETLHTGICSVTIGPDPRLGFVAADFKSRLRGHVIVLKPNNWLNETVAEPNCV